MNQCAPGAGDSAEFTPASLALRAAQRAFAASLESGHGAGEFRRAQRRGTERRTLSALSADDRARLADWLALMLAAGHPTEDAPSRVLARIDMRLAARVGRALPARVEALAIRAGASSFVAA